jgi:predicted  nucleic acid-binding Zn-ribbon protein
LGLTQQLSVALNNQDGIKNQIGIVNTTITNVNINLNSQTQACAQASQNILSLKGNITTLQNSIAGIDQQVAGIDTNINDYNSQIAALQAQINALNAKIAQAKTDKQNLINLNYTVPQQVANINAQISAQQATCQSNYSPIDLSNAQNQLSNLTQQLTGANNIINGINANITAVKGQLTDLLNQNAQLTQQISKVQGDLTTLKQQLPQEQAFLGNLYTQGNQVLQTVQNLNSSLQAATARYNKENNALAIANVNLQQARSQQQTISQSINLILQENTAGLPFPSAPTESGLTNALATINSIDSISHFLLSAYGSSLNFNSLTGFSNLKRLYNFAGNSNIKSNCPDIILSASSAAAQNQTSGSTGLYSGLGTITKVASGNNLTVNTNQGVQNINLDACSIKLSNIPNYSLNVGDVLVWKGTYENSTTSWTANQVTCFH